MAVKNFLICDYGASNGRVSVAAFDGTKFEAETITRFDNVAVNAGGVLYWDVLRLYNDLKTGISSAFKKYGSICSLGIDTWGVDFGFIDKNGKLIANLEHYRDSSRISATEDLFKLIDKKTLFKLTGGLILPGISSIFHMYDLKRRNAPQLNNAAKFLMLPDLFNYFLTGNAFNEYTEATTTIMLNQLEGGWEKSILQKLEIPVDIFCPLIYPGDTIGNLGKSICDELEIPPLKVVAPATHDTASAIAGFPLMGDKKNTLLVSMGTWGIIIQETKSPIINDDFFIAGFANEAGVNGLNMLVCNIAGLWIIQQCMNKWRSEKGQDFGWKDIDSLYPKARPFTAFVDVDDPVFAPLSGDMSATVANYCRAKNQQVPDGAGQTARVLYENLIFKIKNKISSIERITGKKMEDIHIVGGGSKNRLFCQWLADATGLAVSAGPAETTSAGNLLMQLKAEGEINTLSEGRQIVYNSSSIINYTPQANTRSSWEENYLKYLKIISTNS